MTAIEYLLKLKNQKGESYRNISRKMGKSDSYWWLHVNGNKTPTLKSADEFAKALNLADQERKNFINLVFKDRLIRFLEKEGATKDKHTPSIRSLIKSLLKWHPEKGQPIGYIMLTLGEIYGTDFAIKIKQLGGDNSKDGNGCLTAKERLSDLKGGLPVGLDDCSKGFGDLGT